VCLLRDTPTVDFLRKAFGIYVNGCLNGPAPATVLVDDGEVMGGGVGEYYRHETPFATAYENVVRSSIPHVAPG